MSGLRGRSAVVAGASRGIGKGIALELAAAGAHVYAAGRTLEAAPGAAAPGSLRETARDAEALGGTVVPVLCDFTDDRSVARLFEQVREERGGLDIYVHSVFNAGEFRSSIGRRFWELPIDMWADLVDLGTRSAYVAAVHAAPLLIQSDGGLIVHVSGRAASRYRYNVAYGVGKAALDKMTTDMAEELRPEGVAVVSIWPSVTRTEHLAAAGVVVDRNGVPTTEDLDALETPRYSGRAVVALASDPAVMDRSGQRFWVAALAAEYGFTDENGRSHPISV